MENKFVKVKDLKVMDVVRVSDCGSAFMDAVVIKVTEQMVTLFRPYICFDGSAREDIANPHICREEFSIYRGESTITLLRRDPRISNEETEKA